MDGRRERMSAVLAALLALGWPARCMAEPLKVFDNLGFVLVIVGGVVLTLFGPPVLLLSWWYGRRRRQTPPAPRSWPELTVERCVLVQEACRARGLNLQSLVPGAPGLMLTVAAGTQVFDLRIASPEGFRGEALQDALVRSAIERLDALRALLGGAAG